MHPILFILSFLLFFMGSQANPEPPGRYEQRALDILHDAHIKFKSLEAFYAEFEYASTAAGFSAELNNGGFLYAKGDKYHMKLDGNLFISDGLTVWSFMEEINEVHISDFLESEGMITPTSLLENYQDDFRALWIRQELHRGKTVNVIDLVPEDPYTAFSKYRIAIEKDTQLIAYVVAYDRQGGTYSYIITKTNTNPDIPEALFTFNPDNHPDIEVIDLR